MRNVLIKGLNSFIVSVTPGTGCISVAGTLDPGYCILCHHLSYAQYQLAS